jgi:hypothetical protein
MTAEQSEWQWNLTDPTGAVFTNRRSGRTAMALAYEGNRVVGLDQTGALVRWSINTAVRENHENQLLVNRFVEQLPAQQCSQLIAKAAAYYAEHRKAADPEVTDPVAADPLVSYLRRRWEALWPESRTYATQHGYTAFYQEIEGRHHPPRLMRRGLTCDVIVIMTISSTQAVTIPGLPEDASVRPNQNLSYRMPVELEYESSEGCLCNRRSTSQWRGLVVASRFSLPVGHTFYSVENVKCHELQPVQP